MYLGFRLLGRGADPQHIRQRDREEYVILHAVLPTVVASWRRRDMTSVQTMHHRSYSWMREE